MRSTDGWIYVICAPDGPFRTRFKVGWARDPRKRLKELQTANPVELELYCAIRGTVKEERALHDQMELSRTQGEWFQLCPEIEALIYREDAEFLHPRVRRWREDRAYWDRKEQEPA